MTLDADGLGIATLTGPAVGTDYFYSATLDSVAQSDRRKFRTPGTGAQSLSFTAGSCVGGTTPTPHSWTPSVPASVPQEQRSSAHLGDIHYREPNTTNTATILTDWREVLGRTRHKALTAALPMHYTWSDHELGPETPTPPASAPGDGR